MKAIKRSEVCKEGKRSTSKSQFRVGDAVRGVFSGRLGFVVKPNFESHPGWVEVLWLIKGKGIGSIGCIELIVAESLEPINVSLILEDE